MVKSKRRRPTKPIKLKNKVKIKPAARKTKKRLAGKKKVKKPIARVKVKVKKQPILVSRLPLKKRPMKSSASVLSKPAEVTSSKKLLNPFLKEETLRSQFQGSAGFPIPKDVDLDDELNDEEVDITDEADEEDEEEVVEEDLPLDVGEDDSDFFEKPKSLLGEADDYHTH